MPRLVLSHRDSLDASALFAAEDRRWARSRSWTASMLVATALAGSAHPALAASTPQSTALAWTRRPGAEGCIDARALARAVEQQLGRSALVSPAAADQLIEGSIEPLPEGSGFRAHLALSDDHGAVLGVRDLDTPATRCRTFDEHLALVVAMLIDPVAALTPHDPLPAAQAAPAPPRRPCPAPAAPEPPRHAWRVSLGAGGVGALGLLPGAVPGLMLRAELTPPGFVPIAAGGMVWATAHAQAGSKGAEIALSSGALSLCPIVWSRGGTRLLGCAGGLVGVTRALGFGLAQAASVHEVVAGVTLEGRLTQRLVGPLELSLGLDLMAQLRRARFSHVDGAGAEQELYRSGAVAGLADLGLGVAFP